MRRQRFDQLQQQQREAQQRRQGQARQSQLQQMKQRQQQRRVGSKAGPIGLAAAALLTAVAAFVWWSSAVSLEEAWKGRQPDFRRWPAQQRIASHADVGMMFRADWGYALQAQADVAANTSVLTVPWASVLSVEWVLNARPALTAHIGPSGALRASMGTDAEWAQAVLAVGVVCEIGAGDGSKWYDWLRSIPSAPRADLFWTAEEEACLPEWPHRAMQHRRRRAEAVAALLRQLRGTEVAADLPAAGTDDEAARWAMYVVLSRSWWRPAPQHLALLPVADIADGRCRPAAARTSWRPLPANAAVQFDSEAGAVLVTTRPLRRGDRIALTVPQRMLAPAEQTGAHGVTDAAWTQVAAQLDMRAADPRCKAADLFLRRNGTPAPLLLECVVAHRRVGGADPSTVDRAVHKMLSFHATHMSGKWRIPPDGPCSRSGLAAMPHGPELLHLFDAHTEAFAAAAANSAAVLRQFEP